MDAAAFVEGVRRDTEARASAIALPSGVQAEASLSLAPVPPPGTHNTSPESAPKDTTKAPLETTKASSTASVSTKPSASQRKENAGHTPPPMKAAPVGGGAPPDLKHGPTPTLHVDQAPKTAGGKGAKGRPQQPKHGL